MVKTISFLKMSKNGNSCRVEFNDGEKIYLPLDIVLKNNLKTEMPVSEDLLTQLINEKKNIDAKRYAYYIVSLRLHSEYEINQKLKLKGYENEHIEKAINFLKSHNLINDLKFAELFALSCFNKKGYVANRIFIELKKKGIDADIANLICKNFNEDNEIENKLKLLIEKKLRLKQNKSIDKQKTYLIRSLSDLGYDYKKIITVINNYF
jgi:regulatory protein